MKSLLVAFVAFAIVGTSMAIDLPKAPALRGSAGNGTWVRIMKVGDDTVPWDYIQKYSMPVAVAPGSHKVTLKVLTDDYACYPIFDLNVGDRQVVEFRAKADGNLIHVTVNVSEDGEWKEAVVSADVRANPRTVADLGVEFPAP